MKSARSQSFSRLCSVCRSVGPSVTFVFFVVFRSHPVPTRAPSAMSLRGSVYDYTALFKRVQYVFSLNIIDMEQHEPGPNPFLFCSFFCCESGISVASGGNKREITILIRRCATTNRFLHRSDAMR